MRPRGRRPGRPLAGAAPACLLALAVAAGYVEEPERDTLERQVGVLADAAGRFDAGTAFTVGGATEVAGPTTLRAQLDLAARHLRAGCAPDLASRLRAGR